MAIEVVNPNPDGGTQIYEILGGQRQKIGFSTKWNTVTNTSGVGCPSRIENIVVGDTLEEAERAAAAVDIPDEPGVVSSSFTSQNVTEIRVQPDGTRLNRTINYLLVVDSVQPSEAGATPIATEIWFSQEPFADRAKVRAALQNCAEERTITT